MLNILPRPLESDTDMWVDEAIWGHRLYDEQTPWLCILEFLCIVQSEILAGKAFVEIEPNKLQYSSYLRLHLRNILFNNPHLEAIQAELPDDDARWNEWCNVMLKSSGGFASPDFRYLRNRFSSFKDFVEVVKFLQSNSIEGDSNKRWSSKFVFPYGPHCLFEDLRVKGTEASNDRRFFARTGELLYLMLCRSNKGAEILSYLKKLRIVSDRNSDGNRGSKWEQLVAALQPDEDKSKTKAGKPPYLPYTHLPEYTKLADDWLNLLHCNLPEYDSLPHLVTVTGLHLIIYLLSRARVTLGQSEHPRFILEIVSSRKTVVRDLASSSFLDNNNLSQQAVVARIRNLSLLPQWQDCKTSRNPIDSALSILYEQFAWPPKNQEDKIEGAGSPETLMDKLCDQAITRHKQHLGRFHSSWTREIGLSSSRGSRRTRYAPTDSLLKTLVLCSVYNRMEFQDFLAELHRKYGFVIGERQAGDIIASGNADQEAFSDNANRLERRLASIGLLKRLSDACAYVQNPFATELS